MADQVAAEFEARILEHVHTNESRTICETNLSRGSVQTFEVLGEEKPLGQHFHELKAETFVCIAGEGGTVWVARAERIDEGRGRIIGQVTQIEFVPGTVVYVPPYCTHCFRLKKGTKMICFSSEPFNEINKDMVFCPIEV